MQTSLRTHLAAGTAAVVGAGAIAMTPVTAANLQMPDLAVPSVQQVALTALDSPVSEAIRSLLFANEWVWGSAPFVNFGPWADFSAKGVIPQIIKDALPIVRELGLNGSSYIGNSVKGLGTGALVLSDGAWKAIGELLSLDIAGAINTLVGAVQVAGNLALASANFVLTGVVTRATKVATNLASLVPDLVQGAINQPLVLAGAVLKVAQDTITELVALDFEGAWNAAVDGLLGPTGIPGAVTALTIGPGVAGSPIATFVPSIRTEITTVVKAVKDGLATANPAQPPVPPPVAAVNPSASVLREVAAPQSATTTSGSTSGSEENGGATTGGSGGGNESDQGSSPGGSVKSGAKTGKHGLGGSKRAAAKAAASAE